MTKQPLTNQPLPADHFTPDGVFLIKPKHRDVALGLTRYRLEITQLRGFGIVLFLLFFVWFVTLWDTVNSWVAYQALREQQATITAQITDKRISRSEDNDTYYMDYTFTYPDQNGEPQQYRKEIRVSADKYYQTQMGQKIRVYFVPDDPTISQTTPVTIFDILKPTAWFIVAGIVFFFMGRFLIRRFQIEHRLEQNGQLLQGILLEIKGDEDSDGDYWIKARYRFQSPQGLSLDGTYQNFNSNINRLRDYTLPPAGTPVAVWYADDKTHKML